MSTQAYPSRPVWDLLDEVTETKAKKRGMKLAASAHNRDLSLAREIARELGQDGEEVWADLVRVEMLMRFPDIAWGNWAGSIFTGGEWAFVGYTKSTAPGSHSNLLRTWVLKAEGREVAARRGRLRDEGRRRAAAHVWE